MSSKKCDKQTDKRCLQARACKMPMKHSAAPTQNEEACAHSLVVRHTGNSYKICATERYSSVLDFRQTTKIQCVVHKKNHFQSESNCIWANFEKNFQNKSSDCTGKESECRDNQKQYRRHFVPIYAQF